MRKLAVLAAMLAVSGAARAEIVVLQCEFASMNMFITIYDDGTPARIGTMRCRGSRNSNPPTVGVPATSIKPILIQEAGTISRIALAKAMSAPPVGSPRQHSVRKCATADPIWFPFSDQR